MNTSLLIRLISIGKTGFHAFVVTSLTILKLMVLVVMILAIRVKLEGMDVSWFGGSSNLMSWQEHFSVLEMRSAISIEIARFCEGWKWVEGCGCDRNRKVKGGDDGVEISETSSRKRKKENSTIEVRRAVP